MTQQISSPPSKAGNNGLAVVYLVILFLCGFLPFCSYAYVKLDYLNRLSDFQNTSYSNYVIMLSFAGFVTIVAVVVVLMWLANRSWNDEDKTRTNGQAIYSVMFGAVAILFSGLVSFYFSQPQMSLGAGDLGVVFLLPTLVGLPLLGLILGLAEFKNIWGKVGILLGGGQLIFWGFQLLSSLLFL